MRIIPDDIPVLTLDSGVVYGKQFSGKPMNFYEEVFTTKITDEELDAIGLDWRMYSRKLSTTYKPLSQYLRELLELARVK